MKTTSSTSMIVLLCTFMHLQLGFCSQQQSIFLYNNYQKRSIDAKNATEPEMMLLDESTGNPAVGSEEDEGIPLRFFRELDSLTSLNEFYERVDSNPIKVNRKRSVPGSVIPAQPANCQLDPVKVELQPLKHITDPNVYYFPKCTRVNRCSGCCNSDKTVCVPSETEIINFEVEVRKYVNEWNSQLLGKEIIPTEQHNKCECRCRIKPEHCNSPNHKYNPGKCDCSCTNISERIECLSRDNTVFNKTTCKCECKVTIDDEPCTSGTIYDHTICECVKPSDISTTPPYVETTNNVETTNSVETTDSVQTTESVPSETTISFLQRLRYIYRAIPGIKTT